MRKGEDGYMEEHRNRDTSLKQVRSAEKLGGGTGVTDT